MRRKMKKAGLSWKLETKTEVMPDYVGAAFVPTSSSAYPANSGISPGSQKPAILVEAFCNTHRWLACMPAPWPSKRRYAAITGHAPRRGGGGTARGRDHRRRRGRRILVSRTRVHQSPRPPSSPSSLAGAMRRNSYAPEMLNQAANHEAEAD